MLIRGIYGVVYSTIIIGMFRYIIIIIYEVPTTNGNETVTRSKSAMFSEVFEGF